MNGQMRKWLLSAGVVFLLLPVMCVRAQRGLPTGAGRSNTLRTVDAVTGFFPLQVGNEWVYSDGSARFTVQVQNETVESNGLKYFEISGYLPDDPLRIRKLRASENSIYEYNPDGEDFLWYRFGSIEEAWRLESGTNIACVTGSTIRIGDLGISVDVPAGTFARSIRLDFSNPCADAGVESEYFARGIGLVQRTMNTIAGPRTLRLAAANVGGTELPTESYGIELALDHPLYYNNLIPPVVESWPTAHVRLTVRNTTELPVTFTFPTSQRFDFVVTDSLGIEILRWSDNRAFLQVLGQETLAKESRRFSADIVMKTRNGKRLAAGFYKITGYLTSQAADTQRLSSTITFEIRDVQ